MYNASWACQRQADWDLRQPGLAQNVSTTPDTLASEQSSPHHLEMLTQHICIIVVTTVLDLPISVALQAVTQVARGVG
jgi:hypothetical protein